MYVKKSGGKIIGADLTSAERKAMTIEINKELGEYTRKNVIEADATILWELHELLGLGEKRLTEFYKRFVPALDALCKRYEMESDPERIWLCTHKLKEIGVDVEALRREVIGDV